MIRELEKYNFSNNFALVLSSSDLAVYQYYQNISDYQDYKNNTKTFTRTRKLELDTLSLLENLGFPLEKIGTHLYNNIIIKIIDYINNDNITKEDINELLLQLKNAFSQFYLEVARHDLDMGLKTFHKHIEIAIPNSVNIRTNEFNSEESHSTKEIDYGEQAYILARYMLGFNRQKEREVKPKIKKLSNMPDITLRYYV